MKVTRREESKEQKRKLRGVELADDKLSSEDNTILEVQF